MCIFPRIHSPAVGKQSIHLIRNVHKKEWGQILPCVAPTSAESNMGTNWLQK